MHQCPHSQHLIVASAYHCTVDFLDVQFLFAVDRVCVLAGAKLASLSLHSQGELGLLKGVNAKSTELACTSNPTYSIHSKQQRRYDMRYEMLTQRALFCHRANTH